MLVWLSILAALIGAISSGVATVLQKISADRIAKADSLAPLILLRLLRDWPYFTGIVLDLVSWGLTLFAVHNLALFVVQPILAFTVVATILFESVIFHNRLSKRTVMSLAAIVSGLALLGLSATSETVSSYSNSLKFIVVLAPIAMVGLGMIIAKQKTRLAAILLATISGLAFGGVSIAGRMIILHDGYWQQLTIH